MNMFLTLAGYGLYLFLTTVVLYLALEGFVAIVNRWRDD
jgi:hypothetical protein